MLPDQTASQQGDAWCVGENEVTQAVEETTQAFVLEALGTLFKKRDDASAERLPASFVTRPPPRWQRSAFSLPGDRHD